MLRLTLTALLTLLLVLLSYPVLGQEVKLITVNEPPANYIDETGAPAGYVYDIVKALQQELKHQGNIDFVPELRAISLANDNPNILLFSFSRTADRENQYHWIGKVMEKTWRVFALADSKVNITSLDDLRELASVGVVRGDIRQQWLSKRHFQNLSIVTRHKQNLKMLLKGRVDVIVHEGHAIAYLLKELNKPREAIRSAYTLNKTDVYLLMSKQTPIETAKQWREGFTQIKKNKTIDTIAKKWRQKISIELGVGAKLQNGILVF